LDSAMREARRCALATEMEAELATIDLGDERLNKRAGRVLQSFWADPQASINAASRGRAETQAAYRFFDNDQVRSEALLESHQAASPTAARAVYMRGRSGLLWR